MAFNLKTWVNRISEYPNRRKLTHEDGSTELVTVARAEGQISAEGNAFSAEEMNDLENRIKGGFDEVNRSLTNINVNVGEDGKLHFVNSTGADTVIPFSSGYKEVAIVFADYQRVAACILIKPNKSVIYGWGSLQGDYMTLNASGNGNCSIIAKKAGKYLVFDTQATVPKTSTTQVDASANKTIVMSVATTQFSINVAVAL